MIDTTPKTLTSYSFLNASIVVFSKGLFISAPALLIIISILLVLNFIYLNKDTKQIVPLMILGLGLITLTIGSFFPLYMKCLVMSGILLISASVYIFKKSEPNRFGYNQIPINNMTGTEFVGNTEILKQRIPLDYPNPSNI